MDEELKSELLSLLRELKNGASPAFQELVAQRSAYCMTVAVESALLAVLLGIGVIFGLRAMMAGMSAAKNDEGRSYATMTGAAFAKTTTGVVVVIPCLIGLVIAVSHAAAYLPEGMAPLGRVMEMLR